jgi:predicted DsbA family dithiol-disulfide isomerase
VSIEKLKANYPVTIRWVHFPLHPETPEEGKSLEELFAGRDMAPIKERMKGLMAEAGLAYSDRTHTYNSRLAQKLGKWADTQQDGEAIHDKLYRAYFVDGVNISDIDVLVKIAESAGLDADAAREVLDTRSFKDHVDADWQRSREHGITGVPTFSSNDLLVVGCQPYETLEKFVSHLQELQISDIGTPK